MKCCYHILLVLAEVGHAGQAYKEWNDVLVPHMANSQEPSTSPFINYDWDLHPAHAQ